MAFSSWGAEGYGKVWLNAQNAAFYRHQHHAERRFERLLDAFPAADGLVREALLQAGRELLLAQSSDWAFIVTNATAVPYAVRRFREAFASLSWALRRGRTPRRRRPRAE